MVVYWNRSEWGEDGGSKVLETPGYGVLLECHRRDRLERLLKKFSRSSK